MDNTKNKNIWIGIVVILAIIAIIFLFSLLKKDVISVDDIISPPDDTVALEPQSTLDISGITNANGSQQTTPISYTEALMKYTDKRIQFDKICQAFPNFVTYKDNTGIMIDNRSPQARTIKIDTNYSIKAYGFKIIVLPDIYLKSETLLVDCDKSQNVATILVQE